MSKWFGKISPGFVVMVALILVSCGTTIGTIQNSIANLVEKVEVLTESVDTLGKQYYSVREDGVRRDARLDDLERRERNFGG